MPAQPEPPPFGPAWVNPTPRDIYDLVVIGGGPGGLSAARAAVALGATVAVVERHSLGGPSLSVASVPSKALLRTSRLASEMRRAETYGVKPACNVDTDFQTAMARMRDIRARIGEADAPERLAEDGVDLYFGHACFTGRRTVAVGRIELRFRKALIATGSRSLEPDSPGLTQAGYLTNETVFDLIERPKRLLVMGGGPTGCELAQAFGRLGCHVIIAQDDPTFLPKEERDAAQILSDALARDGIEVHLNTSVTAVRVDGDQKVVELTSDDSRFEVSVDQILVGIGRAPNVDGMDLDAAGVRFDRTTGIAVNDFLRTSNRRIYAAGDVCLEQKFAHTAEASAQIAALNALAFRRERFSGLTVPWCTYTDPEVAHVGLYAREAWRRSIPVKTYVILMHDVDRAVTDSEDEGFVKIHVREGTDRILGATIVARHAGEMIGEVSLAIRLGLGMRDLARVIHAYPTQASAINMAAIAYVQVYLSPPLRWLRDLRIWTRRRKLGRQKR